MKRVITFSLCVFAIVAFSFSSFAQDFSVNQNQVTESFGQGTFLEAGGVTITHSVSDSVIVGSITCSAGGITSDNQFWRSFVLSDFGITDEYKVTLVDIGIETAISGDGTGVQPMTCNLYITDGTPFPGGFPGSLTLIGTLDMDIPDQALTHFFIPVAGIAPPGSELVVEISIPDATGGAGHMFWIGSNPLGQTAPSYLSSAGCALTTPTDIAAIGFPDMHIVMSVTGDVNPGGGPLFVDDFESGLGQWTISNQAGPCDWEILFPAYPNTYTLPCGASCDGVLVADTDFCLEGFSSTATTSPIDATGMGIVTLTFDNDWRTIASDDEAHVEVSTDGGGSWSSVVSWVGVDQRNTSESFDISSMVAGTSFMVRFRTIQPGFDWWWAVDNVAIDGIVPVELTSFAANVNENNVTLNWTTATELNNQGFDVERNSGNGFEKIGFVAGFGTSTEIHSYFYVDGSLQEGTYPYRLKQIDYDGTFEYSDVVEVDVTVPDVFALEQNYPNPFNPSTKIRFSLAADSKVSLTVFDVLGQEVANLINGNLKAGSHEISFNASNINSGVYFYKIDATGIDGTNFTSVKKMILTK